MTAQLRHIDPGQVSKHLAFPLLPVAGPPQQWRTRLGPQREALAPVGRRRGV